MQSSSLERLEYSRVPFGRVATVVLLNFACSAGHTRFATKSRRLRCASRLEDDYDSSGARRYENNVRTDSKGCPCDPKFAYFDRHLSDDGLRVSRQDESGSCAGTSKLARGVR